MIEACRLSGLINDKHRNMNMNVKTIGLGLWIAALCATLVAAPSANNLEAVKSDWWNGNYTYVLELAQQRFAANANDLVVAHLMMGFDTAFSRRDASSNSVMRLVRVSDEATLPAYTNLYRATRSGWIRYANKYLPSRTDARLSGRAEGVRTL